MNTAGFHFHARGLLLAALRGSDRDPLIFSHVLPVSGKDRDGMPDTWEKNAGLDIKRNDSRADPDNDKLQNIREYRLKTNPIKSDTDGDGIKDGEEVRKYGTDPTKRDSQLVDSTDGEYQSLLDNDNVQHEDQNEESDGDGETDDDGPSSSK